MITETRMSVHKRLISLINIFFIIALLRKKLLLSFTDELSVDLTRNSGQKTHQQEK